MSCGCSSNSFSACPEVPYPSISPESVPSLIDNLVYALYGTIEKSVSSGRVIWNIPCDPNNTAEVPTIPREEGEGLLCYIIRCFDAFVSGGINFNQNTNYLVTNTLTARNLATRGGDIINVKDFGAVGDGTADDTLAIQAAITAATVGAAIYFPKGLYKASRVQITKSITIFGDGIDVTQWVYGLNTGATAGAESSDAYFVVSGQNTNFDISNGTIIDKFGLRYVGQGVITTAIGCSNAYSTDFTTFPNKVKVFNVKFIS